MTIFDFDGTLVDVWKRYYEIFKWWNLNIDINTFKRLKWQYENEMEILRSLGIKFEENDFKNYKRFKDQKIEEKDYLSLDELILDPTFVKEMKERYLILTMRKNIWNFLWQVENLKIRDLFKEYVVLEPKGINTKLEWLKHQDFTDEINIVGDSEVDLKMIEASSKKMKINVYLVKSGLRNPYKTIQNLGLKAAVIENVNCFFQSRNII